LLFVVFITAFLFEPLSRFAQTLQWHMEIGIDANPGRKDGGKKNGTMKAPVAAEWF
jgi:hypothetical protein